MTRSAGPLRGADQVRLRCTTTPMGPAGCGTRSSWPISWACWTCWRSCRLRRSTTTYSVRALPRLRGCGQSERARTSRTGWASTDTRSSPDARGLGHRRHGHGGGCARSVWRGEVRRACNISRGLHHAMPRATSGSASTTTSRWRSAGCWPTARADRVRRRRRAPRRRCAADLLPRPRVLTISLDETPAVLFPGTGFPSRDRRAGRGRLGGQRGAAGRNRGQRLAARLPRGGAPGAAGLRAADPGHPAWLRLPRARSAGRPGTHRGRAAASYLDLAELADALCEGRWVSTGGGGDPDHQRVPRAWTHLLAIVAGQPLSPQTPTPERWRAGWAPPTCRWP